MQKRVIAIFTAVFLTFAAFGVTANAQTKLGTEQLGNPGIGSDIVINQTQFGTDRIQIQIGFTSILDTISRIGIGEYLGSATDQRLLIGNASQVSGSEWIFNWDIRNVNEGRHRLFLIITTSDVEQIETREFIVNVQKENSSQTNTNEIDTSTEPSSQTTPTNTTSVATDIDTLSNLVNTTFNDVEETAEITVNNTTDSIQEASNAIKNNIEDSGILQRIEDESSSVQTEVTNSITRAQQTIRLQVLSGADTERVKEELASTTRAELERLKNLADELDASVDIDVISDKIREDIDAYEEEIRVKKEAFEERGGLALYIDSDDDGVSDYDEERIYNTDPNNRDTDNDGRIDSDEILSGYDPNEADDTRIVYEDVREVQSITTAFRVEDIAVVETAREEGIERARKISFKGKALPNSFITLYIFSSPITVTIKADVEGNWEYTLDQELPDGSHEVYVASVDNTGKVLARSEGVPFVKQAAAIELVDFTTVANEPAVVNPAFIAGGIITLVLIIIITFLAIGHFNRKRDEELKRMSGGDDVNPQM